MGLRLPPSVLVRRDTYSRPTEGCSRTLAVAQPHSHQVGRAASWTLLSLSALSMFPSYLFLAARPSFCRAVDLFPPQTSLPTSSFSSNCPASPLAPRRPPAFIAMATAQPVFYVVMATGVEAQARYNKVETAGSFRRACCTEELRVFVRLLMIQRKRLHGSDMHDPPPPQTNWSEG